MSGGAIQLKRAFRRRLRVIHGGDSQSGRVGRIGDGESIRVDSKELLRHREGRGRIDIVLFDRPVAYSTFDSAVDVKF